MPKLSIQLNNFPKSVVASQIQPKLIAFSHFSWIIHLSNFVPYSLCHTMITMNTELMKTLSRSHYSSTTTHLTGLFNIADTIALLMVFGNMLHAQMLQCPRLILAPLVYEQRRLLGI